jgi:small-conductance mechanosensitive channel
MVLLPLLRRYVVKRLRRLAEKTATDMDDLMVEVLVSTKGIVLVLVAVFAGIALLDLPAGVVQLLRQAFLGLLLLQGAFWGNAAITFYARRPRGGAAGQDAGTATAMRALTLAARFALWVIVGLLLLDNLGVNITGLVAGLGIGGLAVALALQNILGDLFASLTILLDKPFVVGDFIVVESYLGSIEHIGLKTTRLRSLSGEQIIVSNADLLNSRIRNYKRMNERRVVLTLDVTYQTSHAAMVRATGILRESIEEQQGTRFDRAHFKEFSASALRLEAVYYVLDPDYNVFMDVQQAVNLTVLRRFAGEGIEFAYPTTTVVMQNPAVPARDSDRAHLSRREGRDAVPPLRSTAAEDLP